LVCSSNYSHTQRTSTPLLQLFATPLTNQKWRYDCTPLNCICGNRLSAPRSLPLSIHPHHLQCTHYCITGYCIFRTHH